MKYIINDRSFLSRMPEGPLAPHILPFADWARDQRYARHCVQRRVLLAAGFSRWLQQRRVPLQGISWESPAQYLRDRARQKRIAYGDRLSLRQFMEFLCRGGIITAEKKIEPLTPVEQCVQEFEIYLRDQRALAARTIIHYALFIRGFLTKCFGNKSVQLGGLRSGDIVSYVQGKARQMPFKRSKLLTTALRSFLQFARYRGDITADLAAAVPRMAGWSMNAIPRAIPADEVQKLLSSVDRDSAIGRRDYAVLLLLARLGLRSNEVTCLELDDIDWTSGCFSVRGKGDRHSRLPLPADVGEAIVAYLQQGRPTSTSRRLFLRNRAPFGGFRSPTSIAGIVRHAIESAGVNAPTRGAHQFRHGLATEMLRHGASLKEIGELLGHHSIEATKIYARVDVDALRTLALPWPGGAQ